MMRKRTRQLPPQQRRGAFYGCGPARADYKTWAATARLDAARRLSDEIDKWAEDDLAELETTAPLTAEQRK
jgi:hypothetical protein